MMSPFVLPAPPATAAKVFFYGGPGGDLPNGSFRVRYRRCYRCKSPKRSRERREWSECRTCSLLPIPATNPVQLSEWREAVFALPLRPTADKPAPG